MNLRKTLSDVHTALLEDGISHALIGGFALAVYGHHRATSDIDLLADGRMRESIKSVLSKKNFEIRFESAEVLQFTGPGFVDILLANRPLSIEMLTRARLSPELGVYVLRPEDIIGLKIQAYKNDPSREFQDKADIQKLLLYPNLEIERVKIYADLFGEWDAIQFLKGMIK